MNGARPSWPLYFGGLEARGPILFSRKGGWMFATLQGCTWERGHPGRFFGGLEAHRPGATPDATPHQ